MTFRNLTLAFVPFIMLSTLARCSSTEAPADTDAAATNDAAAMEETSPEAAVTDSSTSDVSIVNDASDAAASGSISVTIGGVTTVLTETARAVITGNGYGIGAGKIDGAKLTTILMQLITTDSGGKYIAPPPGVYPCSATIPSAPYMIARMQYSAEGNVYQYGAGATCVTLTQFGAIGQPVVGTFSSVIDRITGSGPASITVTGSFNVLRAN
ncbi:MAG: hypothetical protein KBF88_08405 [Polyangiaceae bacterium]|nr:hypothetical protein [Polyangiaceae bacterium]